MMVAAARSIPFQGAEARRQKLYRIDNSRNLNVEQMGALSEDTAATNWGNELLNLVKTALPIYQGQQVFNQQLSIAKATGTPVAVNASGQVVPQTNWGQIALLGGAAVLGVVLLKRVMGRR